MNWLTIPLVIVLSLIFSIIWTGMGFLLAYFIFCCRDERDDEEDQNHQP